MAKNFQINSNYIKKILKTTNLWLRLKDKEIYWQSFVEEKLLSPQLLAIFLLNHQML